MLTLAEILVTHWYLTLAILVGTLALMGWAMYMLSRSFHVAAAVIVGGLIVAGIVTYQQSPAVSTISFILGLCVVVLQVASQVRMVQAETFNKTIKEKVYDVEEKR